MNAVILAGGFATRLWPLTEKRAKSLLRLKGKPLLSALLEKIPEEIPIVISTNRVFQKDFEKVADTFPSKNIRFFFEESLDDREKRGALKALSDVIEAFSLEGPLLVMAGDNYFGFSMPDFLKRYQGHTMLACFETTSPEEAKGFGVITIEQGQVKSFEEKPIQPKSSLISTGAYIFSPEDIPEILFYSKISTDHIGGIFEHLINNGRRIEAFSFEEPWFDIGSFDQYKKAQRTLLQDSILPSSSRIIQSELKTPCDIGERVVIQNSILEDVLIFDDCVIKNCTLRNCIIDRNSNLSHIDLSHKMIREGTVI